MAVSQGRATGRSDDNHNGQTCFNGENVDPDVQIDHLFYRCASVLLMCNNAVKSAMAHGDLRHTPKRLVGGVAVAAAVPGGHAEPGTYGDVHPRI